MRCGTARLGRAWWGEAWMGEVRAAVQRIAGSLSLLCDA